MMLLHGEQELILPLGALPVNATVTTHARVANVYDKGRGALVVCESVSLNRATGALLAVNRASIFIRGIGNFGGDRGPAAPVWPVPAGAAPAASLRVPTPRSLALLYRLNGDLNPLHVDPSSECESAEGKCLISMRHCFTPHSGRGWRF
jgi:3-hydroxyacyl-CoA dehydrogenase/3a,7a,12a-trihydroxy-5b-cholest-24-enoyl-CoA hydratase